MGLGALFIVISIIMSVQFRFVSTTLFDYLLMLTLAAAGVGLILRSRAK
ncbi:MAG: hypothetical protein IKP28_02540 [Clostridia bacterium]|nr:hypothetical protein [Clostridia bacterium]